MSLSTGLCSAVGNVSGWGYVFDCRFRDRELDPGPVPYIREIISTAILLFLADSRRVVFSYK